MTAPRRRSSSQGQRPTLRIERQLLRSGYARVAAVDEVGRGALAGPVTVGAVVVTPMMRSAPVGLRDSKALTPQARSRLVGPIQKWAVDWSVGHVAAADIDRIGIMAALRLAALRAIAGLREPVDAVLLDGNHDYLTASAQGELFPSGGFGGYDGGYDGGLGAGHDGAYDAGHEAAPEPVVVTAAGRFPTVHLQIKADRDCAGVAAASVLAKTARDALMIDFARIYPDYGWGDNKGYATGDHLAALRALGPCELHRTSWRLPAAEVPAPVADAAAPVGDDGVIAGSPRGAAVGESVGVKGA